MNALVEWRARWIKMAQTAMGSVKLIDGNAYDNVYATLHPGWWEVPAGVLYWPARVEPHGDPLMEGVTANENTFFAWKAMQQGDGVDRTTLIGAFSVQGATYSGSTVVGNGNQDMDHAELIYIMRFAIRVLARKFEDRRDMRSLRFGG